MVCGLVLLGVASPGPNFLLLTKAAASSRSAALATASGFGIAALIWASASLIGVAVVIARHPSLYLGVQLVGAIYLLFLAFKLIFLRASGATAGSDLGTGPPTRISEVGGAFAINIANPKSAVFYTSVMVSIVPQAAPHWFLALAILATGCVSLAWYGCVGLLLSRPSVLGWFARAKRPLDLAFGVALTLLGAHMLMRTFPHV